MNIVLMHIIVACLVLVNTSKNKQIAVQRNTGVSVPRIRTNPYQSFKLVSDITCKAVLIQIIQSVMSIPSPKNVHIMTANCRSVPKPR